VRTILSISILLLATAGIFGQTAAKKPTDLDKTEAIPSEAYLKRGEAIGKAEKVSLAKVLDDPAKFSGRKVMVEGLIVRSCKAQGCWAELAPDKAGKSVRVTMKDSSFFIPLQSAGAEARAEGVFSIKALGKEHVDHSTKGDADKPETEISFEASGIELRRREK
jgi:Domain of unknown function (DUF4920)